MNNALQQTLQTLLQSGTVSNPALNRLIADYTEYHAVLVVVGGLFSLGFALLGLFCWRQFRKAARAHPGPWTFERKSYFSFGLLGISATLLMTLIVAANLSNTLNPRAGFSGSLEMIRMARPGTPRDQMYQSFNAWLQSGSAAVPALVQQKIEGRLAWQRPKAIICGFLLIVFAMLSARIWRTLVRGSRSREIRWNLQQRALFGSGVFTVAACFLTVLMVIGNTQGSLAPIALTLFFT